MQNESLVADYLRRSQARLKSIDTLFGESSWSDVVRESQEVVELCLKGLLRHIKIEPPRIHDVGDVLLAAGASFPKPFQINLKRLAKISGSLRRDRELAFYGSEDLTPSDFYKKDDAVEARDSARWVVQTVVGFVGFK